MTGHAEINRGDRKIGRQRFCQIREMSRRSQRHLNGQLKNTLSASTCNPSYSEAFLEWLRHADFEVAFVGSTLVSALNYTRNETRKTHKCFAKFGCNRLLLLIMKGGFYSLEI